ncbi:MAG: hypothetical protein R3C58_02130 [Parvularculaceae bacterium]
MLLALVTLAQLCFSHVHARANDGKPGGAATLVSGSRKARRRSSRSIGPMISLLTGRARARAPALRWLAPLWPFTGLIILVLIVGPWLYARSDAAQATEGRFLTEAVGRDMLGKVGDAQEGHAGARLSPDACLQSSSGLPPR